MTGPAPRLAPPDFFTPAVLALQWGWSEAGIRRACARGRIPGARRFGGRWIIARAVLLRSFGESPSPPESPPSSTVPAPRAPAAPPGGPRAGDLDRLYSSVYNGPRSS
jgi:hypothetical protein